MKTLAILSLLVLSPAVFAWGETGHMVVAEIAYGRLSPTAKAEADRLLQFGKTERTYDFVTVGPWADEIRKEKPETGPMHYKDYFFREDGKVTTNKSDEVNAVTAINRYAAILRDKSKTDADRADALRFVIHFVADIHQPLHATARVTDALPKGDRGGNDFKILPPAWMGERGPTNLHALWDGGVGLFDRVERPLDRPARSAVQMIALSLEAGFPFESLRAQAEEKDPEKWTQESFEIAKRSVYKTPEGNVPSERYFTEGQQIVARQVTLAGYRLAELLNRTL